MRYLVTGATGFIGGQVARLLAERGDSVVALVRDPASAQTLARLGVELARGDVTERASVRDAMRGADGVFHLAAWYKWGAKDKSMAVRTNVEGTRIVLETARDLAISKTVYTSALAVYSDTQGRLVDESYRYNGPHVTEHDRTKWVAYHEVALPLARAGLPLVIVLPGLTYGPGDASASGALLDKYSARKLPMVPHPSIYCWAYVDDVARAHLLAMDHGRVGESYIIAGEPHSFVDVLAVAEKLTGIKPPRLRASPRLMRMASKLLGFAERFISLPPAYSAEVFSATAGVTYMASNEKAKRELGYAPRSLEAGLRATLMPQAKSATSRQASAAM